MVWRGRDVTALRLSPSCTSNVESIAKRACHRRGAAFAEEDAIVGRSSASCVAAHVFEVLCALGVSVVRFCSEVNGC